MPVSNFYKKWRIYFVAIVAIFVVVYIYAYFASLAFKPQKEFSTRTPTVERGSILDRNGQPLAVQKNFYHYGVSPRMIKNPSLFAECVCKVLEMRSEEIESKINEHSTENFVYIKKKISQEMYDELITIVKQNNFSSFSRFDKIPGRAYPGNDLASQLIGYMGDDGVGLSGIEYSQQSVLSPKLTTNATKDVYGENVYLTIDASLQFRLEKIAKETMQETQAESMMIIASDAKNGEILSYISLPSTDLNHFASADKEETIDRPAVSAFEPGSVFKIFSAAAFIDSNVVTKDQTFLCDGVYERTTNLGETIKITCLEHHGWVDVRGALKYSCNDAFSQMSDELDTQSFLSWVHKFGFGSRTGIELPSETPGSVKSQKDKFWSARSKPTMSIGQEISVNALQMVQAATVIANQGIPVKPTVIHSIKDKDGNETYTHTPEYGERVLKSSTAKYILSCMETTAQSGTGHRASLGDISIGVKTGTAQMADLVNGGYSQTDFLSNCLAVFPVEDPEIILYIVIEKAKGETYAGRIVAPVIAKVADEIIDQLGMTRQKAESYGHTGNVIINGYPPLNLNNTVPNFIGYPKRPLLPLLESNDKNINFIINGEGWVVSQNPAPGTPIMENMIIELTFE